MALVALLKGVNVGGHRTFRPSALSKELAHLEVVNVGGAGTFVVRKPIARMDLREEIRRRVPFEVEVMICSGNEILRLVSSEPFAGDASRSDIVQFVSVMAKRRVPSFALPLTLPTEGDWCLKVFACQARFVVGVHRREMKAIGCLGHLEKVLGTPLTTRSWSTILTIARILRSPRAATA